MKKILSLTLLLALMVCICAGIVAAVDLDVTNDNDAEHNVTLNVTANTSAVYGVTITWTDLSFRYNYSGWDAENAVYTGGWQDNGGSVTITNKSNAAILYSAEYACTNNTYNNISVKFDSTHDSLTDVEIASAVGGATSDSFTLTADGIPVVTEGAHNIGKVTVQITPKP